MLKPVKHYFILFLLNESRKILPLYFILNVIFLRKLANINKTNIYIYIKILKLTYSVKSNSINFV